MAPLLARCIIWGWLALGAVASDDADLYRKVTAVNTSECLDKVRALPLKVYEFAYDTVRGRRQLGVVGSELESVLPEAVDVVRSQAFKNPDTSPGAPALVKLSNFPVVDKNVLFMHNVGAVQHLIGEMATVDALVAALSAQEDRAAEAIARLEARVEEEVEAQAMEEARQAEAATVLARAEVAAAVAAAEEERAALIKQAEVERATVAFEAKLAEDRVTSEDARLRARAAEAARLTEEAALRSEERRRATELALKAKQMEQDKVLAAERRVAELERVSAEAKAKAKAERTNEDIALRAIRARGAEERRRLLEAITSVFSHLGRGATNLLASPKQLGTLLGSVLVVVAGGFLAREGAVLARQLLEARLGRPKLVRETSRATRGLALGLALAPFDLLQFLVKTVLALLAWSFGPRNWMRRFRQLHQKIVGSTKKTGSQEGGERETSEGEASASSPSAAALRATAVVSHFADVVLPGPLTERVTQLAVATRNAKQNQVPFRHLLLYGPPGTGKTMVAQRLAQASGMDYALMSGGDVGPLGKDAVTELHALFRWAQGSPSGLLLFIDEAEAFLGSRSRSAMSEELRNALNALLYQTGSQSYNFMMVLATNRAEDLDSAVLDRMDESLYLGLPDAEKRRSLTTQYFDAYVHAQTAAGRRAREPRWHPRKMVRTVFGHRLADVGLPPPLKVTFCDQNAKPRKGGGTSQDSSSSSLEQQAEAEEAAAKVTSLSAAADQLEGFSGREISKLMIALQSVAFGSAENELTGTMVASVVSRKVEEHKRKVDMVQYAHASPTHRAAATTASGNGKISAPGSPMRSPSNKPAN